MLTYKINHHTKLLIGTWDRYQGRQGAPIIVRLHEERTSLATLDRVSREASGTKVLTPTDMTVATC